MHAGHHEARWRFYEQEIRRRIKILERSYGVDIWTEDLDRLRRAPK